jgi:Arc/MetJ-type ribon-helix-helix transcriptional regulator
MSELSGNKVKLSITLPPEQAAMIEEAVREGRVDSASAFIAARLDEAANRAAERERTRRWIRELNGGPIDDEARAYWLRQFGVTGEDSGQVSA